MTDLMVRPFTMDEYILSEVNVYVQRVRPPLGGVVVDAGAHIGGFSILASRLVGPTGMVFAFEPHPENFAILSTNLERAGATNVRSFNTALGSMEGTSTMPQQLSMNTGAVQLGEGEVRVPVIPLDVVVNRADFIKVDVEGAELDVLRGAERILRERPVIVAEVHSAELARQAREFLEARGYAVTVEPYTIFTGFLSDLWLMHALPVPSNFPNSVESNALSVIYA